MVVEFWCDELLWPEGMLLAFVFWLEFELLTTGVLAEELFGLEPPTTPDIGCVALFWFGVDETGIVESVVFDIVVDPNKLVR